MDQFTYVDKEKVGKLPKIPGVYAFKVGKDYLYIGKASDLRVRVKNHFQQPTWRDSLYIDQVTRIGYIPATSDIDALLLESSLIKKHQPKYNVMWKDDKNYTYIVITKEKLPRVFTAHQKDTKIKAEYLGPFIEGRNVRRVLKLLRRVFPYYTSKKHPAVACSYCHLDLCPGPNPKQAEYKRNIANLKAVLQGKRTSVLKTLKKEMTEVSRKEQYEKASWLRDQISSLERIIEHSFLNTQPAPLRSQPDYHAIEKELRKVLHTRKRISRMEAYDISNIQGHQSTGSMVVFIEGKPSKKHYRKFKIKITGKPNDFAMMKELITRRLSHKDWSYPDVMLIDGGKGQLSSAMEAIAEQKQLGKFKVVALAKRNNELFFPNNPEPALLKDMGAGLEHMLLHIRDEAHRFAITYYRKLHKVDLLSR